MKILFLVLSLVIVLAGRDHPGFGTFTISFAALMLEAMPFLVAGALIAGCIEVFVKPDFFEKMFKQRTRFQSIFIGTCMGLVLPVCECGIVPIAMKLVKKRVPIGAVMGYLFAAPSVNPLVFASTWMAYGYDWEMPLTRLAGSWVTAILVAIVLEMASRRTSLFVNIKHQEPDGSSCSSTGGKWQRLVSASVEDFLRIGAVFCIGACAAALAQSFIPRVFLGEVAESSILSVITMMGAAVVLNVCSEADAFIAASLRWVMPLSSQLAFLMLGPVLDLKLMLLYAHFFRKKVVISLIIGLPVIVFTLVMIVHVTGWLNGHEGAWR